MGTRVCVVNLGCKVNRVESDWMESAFSEAGCVLVPEGEAQLIAINTCAVTGEAQAKTRKAVRHAANLPQHPLVAVTGCVANLFPEELEALSSRVHVFKDKNSLATESLKLLSGSRKEVSTSPTDKSCEDSPAFLPTRVPQPRSGEDCLSGGGNAGESLGAREIKARASAREDCLSRGGYATSPRERHHVVRSRRGVKVQDGCDNRCTYCIVWRARGASTSMPLADIESQVRQVLVEGADEVVLSGINLGRFRAIDEFGAQVDLSHLLDRVCALGARMVRLSSIEPPDLTQAVVESMVRNAPAVCHHLHLPLQSGCDTVLARMGRAYTAAEFVRVVERIRALIPNASLSTDVIVGFPGETEEEFEQTLAFCRAMRFSKMHVFRYSARPETEAAQMPCQVNPRVAQRRSERLRALAQKMRRKDAAGRIGCVERVLVERVDKQGAAHGSTASYHDVVLPAGSHGLAGPGLVDVELTGIAREGGAGLLGRVVL